jgi:hypothetical protein
MVSVTVSLVAFLALIAWRFVFAGLQRSPSVREINNPRRQGNNLLDRVGAEAIAGERFENRAQGADLWEREERAKAYLRRIVALTGASQTANNYVLNVGRTRFHVRDRYVRRLRDLTDPKCDYEETCFCLPYSKMPTAEQIATALLQLTNNPALFDLWAAQMAVFKADGQVFTARR